VASLLDFSQYIGGQDNIQTEVTFPSSQRTVVYDFGQNITGWQFKLDFQTVVVDTVAYDRNTGAPNFASSSIIGTFPGGVVSTATFISVLNASSGTVSVTLPGGLYDGPIIPDARAHTPITIFGFSWTTNANPPQVDTHRWALLMSYEPGVTPGDPILDPAFDAISVGA
jgi:hypothetical protein